MARNFDLLFDSLGHFGRYQAWVYFASAFQAMSCGIHYLASVFLAVTPRMGRRYVLWLTSTGQFIFGIAVAFTFDYNSFVIVRFLLAMVSSGYLVVVFVYVTEFIGVKARTWASMQVHAFFAVGIMVVALVGYLAQTWWVYQICLSITTLPFVLCCWMLPETPFWLLTEGRNEEAQKVINVMARWNKVSTPCKISELCSVQDDLVSSRTGDNDNSSMKKHTILDLFHNWHIARRTITVWLVWFTGSLGYYVFSLSSVNLGGNEYLNLFLIGAVELPAYVIACIGLDKLGRRNTLIPFLISSAVMCAVVMVIPQDFSILIIIANMAGKCTIGVAFGLIYLYTAELYPTVARSLAVGSGSMMCRVGSVVAPFCVYLSSVWIFMPQLIVGIMAFVSGLLTLTLPETLGKPLTNTWAEAAELDDRVKKDSGSGKTLPVQRGAVLDKIEMLNQEANGIDG